MLRALPLLLALLTACQAASTPESTSTTTKPKPPSMAPRDKIPPPLPLERGVVVVTGTDGVAHRFAVEVCDDDKERQRGLMYREKLDDEAGMLFIFEEQRQLSFWMRNTWIPLDMLFIDEDLVVKGIVENAEPLTTTGRKIDGATRHVLEVNGGLARKLGITAGAKVQFEGIPESLWQKKNTQVKP